MSKLIITDLHLTDSPRDSYRWGIFPWLIDHIKSTGATELYVLGDLTEKKDRHSAWLVNQIADRFYELTQLCRVVILKGNHDYIEESMPFFKWLSLIDRLSYIDVPMIRDGELFLPHSKNVGEWQYNLRYHNKYKKAVYCHQAFTGALTNSGYSLDGADPVLFKDIKCPIYSGDIHTPQKVGNIVYIGSPYPVYFGDTYQGRVLFLDDDGVEEWFTYSCLKRHSITLNGSIELEDMDVVAGDQVKIRLELPVTESLDWDNQRQQIKAYCEYMKIDLVSLEVKIIRSTGLKRKAKGIQSSLKTVDYEDTLKRFSEVEKLTPQFIAAGLTLMKEAGL